MENFVSNKMVGKRILAGIFMLAATVAEFYLNIPPRFPIALYLIGMLAVAIMIFVNARRVLPFAFLLMLFSETYMLTEKCALNLFWQTFLPLPVSVFIEEVLCFAAVIILTVIAFSAMKKPATRLAYLPGILMLAVLLLAVVTGIMSGQLSLPTLLLPWLAQITVAAAFLSVGAYLR